MKRWFLHRGQWCSSAAVSAVWERGAGAACPSDFPSIIWEGRGVFMYQAVTACAPSPAPWFGTWQAFLSCFIQSNRKVFLKFSTRSLNGFSNQMPQKGLLFVLFSLWGARKEYGQVKEGKFKAGEKGEINKVHLGILKSSNERALSLG